ERGRRLRGVRTERQLTLVHPFDDWNVIHGQGTAGLELFEDEPTIDLVATPVGGGGLLSGTAIAAKSHDASVRVVGVEPAVADDAYRSWKTGKIQTLDGAPATLADGVRTTAIGERSFEVMFGQGLVDEIVIVSEDEIAGAVKLAWTRLHLALEPTGAMSLAAFVSGKLRGRRVGLVLTGGNANLETVSQLLLNP